MPRGELSEADRILIDGLGERGVIVSSYQLERWRGHGLLPRNHRAWPGRPSGSTSTPAHDALVIAEALARHQRTGRNVSKAALQVFTAYPLVPLPEEGVRAALEWYARHRQTFAATIAKQVPTSGGPDAILDAGYAAAADVVERHGGRRGRILGTSLFAAGADHAGVEEVLPTVLLASAIGVQAVGLDSYWDAIHKISQRLDPDLLPESAWKTVRVGIERDMNADGSLQDSLERPLPPLWDLASDLHAIKQAPFDLIRSIRDNIAILIDAAPVYLAGEALIPDHAAVREWTSILQSDPLVRVHLMVLGPVCIAPPAHAWKHISNMLIGTLASPTGPLHLARTIQLLGPSLDRMREIAVRVNTLLGSPSLPEGGAPRQDY